MKKTLSITEVIASVSVNAGGTGMFMSDICHYLPNTSATFSLLTATESGVEDLPIDQRVEVYKLKTTARKSLLGGVSRPGTAEGLTSLAKQNGIDLVHLHGLWLDICRDSATWARKQKTCFVSELLDSHLIIIF